MELLQKGACCIFKGYPLTLVGVWAIFTAKILQKCTSVVGGPEFCDERRTTNPRCTDNSPRYWRNNSVEMWDNATARPPGFYNLARFSAVKKSTVAATCSGLFDDYHAAGQLLHVVTDLIDRLEQRSLSGCWFLAQVGLLATTAREGLPQFVLTSGKCFWSVEVGATCSTTASFTNSDSIGALVFRASSSMHSNDDEPEACLVYIAKHRGSTLLQVQAHLRFNLILFC